MTDKCEPPKELRGINGQFWLQHQDGGPPLVYDWFGRRAQCWLDGAYDRTPAEMASRGWRYLAPVTPPAEVDALRADLERERMRLAACGVVALSDTPESAARNRDMHSEYRSASCDDVARRVDECMALRARVARLEHAITGMVSGASHENWPLDCVLAKLLDDARTALES